MPSEIEHGGDMLCSFSACRNEGIKFCYCSHCGIPVAKRNFWQRHGHESQTKKQAKAIVPQATTSQNFLPVRSQLSKRVAPSSQSKLPPPAPRLTRPSKEDHLPKGEGSGTSTNSSIDTDQSSYDEDNKRAKSTASSVFSLKERQAVTSGSDGAVSSSLNHKQQLHWASLLRQRPSDKNGDDMSAWLLSVIEVSSPSRAESAVGEADAANKRETSRNTMSVDAPTDGAADNTSGSSAESSPSEGDGTSGSTDSSSPTEEGGSSSDSNSDCDYANNFVTEGELTMRGSDNNPRGASSAGSGGSAEFSMPTHVYAGAVDSTSETAHHPRSSANNKESRDTKKRRLAADDAAVRGN
jgi:hypothetical protein